MPAAAAFFKALSEPTRLRVIHLLTHGPLCVCHIHEILELPQAKVSRHLGYLRKAGLVEARRYYNWTLYSLPASPTPLMRKTLKILDKSDFLSDPIFSTDKQSLDAIDTSTACEAASACC